MRQQQKNKELIGWAGNGNRANKVNEGRVQKGRVQKEQEEE